MLGRLLQKTGSYLILLCPLKFSQGPVPEQLDPQTLESVAAAAGSETLNLEDVVNLVPFVDKALEDHLKLSSQVYRGLKANFSKTLGEKNSLPEIDPSILKIIESDLDIINSKLNQ